MNLRTMASVSMLATVTTACGYSIQTMTDYESIPGASPQHLVNTTTPVFKEPTDDELYVLVMDRWFRAVDD